MQGRWSELGAQITDELLAEWVVVGSFDQLASQLKQRAAGAYTSVLLDIPQALRDDEGQLGEIVAALKAQHWR